MKPNDPLPRREAIIAIAIGALVGVVISLGTDRSLFVVGPVMVMVLGLWSLVRMVQARRTLRRRAEGGSPNADGGTNSDDP
ncbi:MAG: hypothetical protein WBD40_00145 [Tepidisphaeraceae bacterium]